MFQSVQNRDQSSTGAVVDVAPLIDIVFILLIFFLVTTTFVRDTGVRVDRPRATVIRTLEPTSMRISIAPSGRVYVDRTAVSMDQLRDRVRQFVSKERHRSVIVIPDKTVSSGRLIEVMDAARMAGADDVAVATDRSR